MIRWVFAILGGALLGGVVHLVSVLVLPRVATLDAYSRLAPITKLNAVTALPAAAPSSAPMPFMDPAFASAACRYDLSSGPLKLTVPVSQAYTSVSFYTRNDVAYYAINDRSAGRRVIESTIRQKLPDDFQSAEYTEKHGFIDRIVERGEMKAFIARMLDFWGF